MQFQQGSWKKVFIKILKEEKYHFTSHKWQKVGFMKLQKSKAITEAIDAPAIPEKQIQACVEWLRLFGNVAKTIRPNWNSYELKHEVEKWLQKNNRPAYVSNEAFIAAAEREGFKNKRIGDSPNVFLI
jgi:hypothetical protein